MEVPGLDLDLAPACTLRDREGSHEQREHRCEANAQGDREHLAYAATPQHAPELVVRGLVGFRRRPVPLPGRSSRRRVDRRFGLLECAVARYQRFVRITVLYFAVLRERLGRSEESLSVPDGNRVKDAIDLLTAKYWDVAQLRGKFRIAINEEFIDDEAMFLRDGDTMALVPPVAGGADAGETGGDDRHVKVLDEPLSLDRVVRAVTSAGMGGIVTFTGAVRRHSRGTTVEKLEYSAYDSMAIREMTRLCDEIEAEVAGCKLAVEHRVGALAIGDVAVVIAAAAPHRAEAFTACRAMIDRLKDRVPIWKKEFGEDGAEWIGLGP